MGLWRCGTGYNTPPLSRLKAESGEPAQDLTSGRQYVSPVRVTRVLERPDTSHTLRVAGEFTWKEKAASKDRPVAKVLKLNRPWTEA